MSWISSTLRVKKLDWQTASVDYHYKTAIKKSIDDDMMLFHKKLSHTNHETLVEATKKDQQLQILKQVICQGWPDKKCDLPLEIMPFWDHRDELSTYNAIVYRGECTDIPAELRSATLKTIHSSHQGILKSNRKPKTNPRCCEQMQHMFDT